MGSNMPFENPNSQPERADMQPDLTPEVLALDASLRRLSRETHPQPAFVARLRSDLEQKGEPGQAAARSAARLTWTRPFFAQAALVMILLSLVALALGLAPQLQPRPTPIPGVGIRTADGIRRATGAPAPGPDGTAPSALLARLGKGRILALDASPDNLLAVGASTGVCTYRNPAQPAWCAWADEAILAVSFKPTGDRLAVGLGNGHLQILDAATGQILAERASTTNSSITGLAWDPSGAPVVAAVNIPGEVNAWDYQTNSLRWGPKHMPSGAERLAWARGANGESILVAAGPEGITFLDGDSGIEMLHLDPTWQVSPILGLSALDFSTPAPGQQPWLAYAFRGGVTAFKMDGWQISAPRSWFITAAAGSSDADVPAAFLSLAFDPQAGSSRLVVAGADGLRQVEVEEVEQLAIQPPVTLPILTNTPLAWTPAGDLYFALPGGQLAQAPAGGGQHTVVSAEYTTYLNNLAWNAAGLVATNGVDEVRRWQVDGALARVDALAFGAPPESLLLSPDGVHVAGVFEYGTRVALWDLAAGQPDLTVNPDGPATALAFSSDGAKLAILTEDGHVTAYEVQTGRLTGVGQSAQPGGTIREIAWAPAGYGSDVVAAAWSSDDGSTAGIDLISLDSSLDWSSKQLVRAISPVTGLAWGASSLGKAGLLAAFQSEQAVLWDAETGAERFRLGETPQMASIFNPTLAFSPDGIRLAVTTRAAISVWNLPDANEVYTFPGQDHIAHLVVSPDNTTLAAASEDGAIRLWDLTAPPVGVPTPTPHGPTVTPSQPAPVDAPTSTPIGEPTATPTPLPLTSQGGALARLGYGSITTLNTAPDGRLAVGTTSGVCLHNTGMSVDWCRWVGFAHRVAFDPSGNTLAVAVVPPSGNAANEPKNPLLILDARSGATLAERRFHSAWFPVGDGSLAWDPSGSNRIAVAEIGGLLSVWDWQADQIDWGAIELSGPVGYDNQGFISALDWAFGPNGESIIAAASPLGLSLLDGATGELKQRYDPTWQVAPVDNILALAFAPDDGRGPGRHLAYATADENLLVLEMQGWTATGASAFDILPTGDPQASSGAARLAWAPAVGANGDLRSMRLALAFSNNLWRYEPFKEGETPQFITACHTCAISWSADGASLFLQDYSGMLSAYTATTLNLMPYPLDYTLPAQALAWSDELIAFRDITTTRWDVANLRLGSVSLLGTGKYHQTLIAVSPDGRQAAYLLPAQKSLQLLNVATNQQLTLIDAAPGPVTDAFDPAPGAFDAAFSADGSRLVTVTKTGAMTLWHVPTGRPLRGASPLAGANQIDAVAFSPDGDTAAIAWTDPQGPHLTLYRFLGGTITANLNLSDTTAALAFSPDGRLVAAAGGFTTLIVDAATGAVLHNLGPEIDPQTFGTDAFAPGAFNSLAFSPDSGMLATGGSLVTLWDTASGALVQTLQGHTTPIISLAFRPDRGLLASASNDGAILLWDLGAGLPVPEVVPTPTAIQ